MPLKVIPPRAGKTPNYSIRGTYLGIAVDRSAGTPKRKIAEQQRAKLEGEIERGEYPPKPKLPDAPTFLSAAVAYMKAGGARRYMKTLIAHFKDTPLDEMTQEAIDSAGLLLHPHVTPATRNGYVHTPVSAVLHHAGREITVKRPKGYKGKVTTRFLLPPDAFAIIESARSIDEEMSRMLTFLLYTGCRISEAQGLKWENVSVERGEAYIETSKNEDPRTVRLTQDAMASLGPVKRAGRVFRFHQGGHRNFLFLNAKVTACGLPAVARPKPGEKQQVPPYRFAWVHFHTFCHTWATWMRRFGGSDLQGLVATGRWRDPRSAQRYTHVVSHEEWDRVDALPKIGKSVESTVKKAKAQ